jgi:hypothetical protein
VGCYLLSLTLFGGVGHAYKLAPASLLPENIKKAPEEIRDAYRFAVANRDALRYIPCYCGCGKDGHTSNASCYVKDNSLPGKLEFDLMSLG